MMHFKSWYKKEEMKYFIHFFIDYMLKLHLGFRGLGNIIKTDRMYF